MKQSASVATGRSGSPGGGSRRAQAPIRKGNAALARQRWKEARAWFEQALSVAPAAEALEGLGMAAWWLDDATVVFEARERAFQLYRQRGDCRGAGRIAMALAGDHVQFRGQAAVARGWYRRAQRLLDGMAPIPEHGWLKVGQADLALTCGDDPSQVSTMAAEAAIMGRTLGAIDLEMTALALEGLALVTAGKPAQGLPCLDEAGAAAVSGEMTDPLAIGVSFCYVVTACERIRDFERAAQWCARAKEFCEKTHFNALLGVCRAQYASVLMWRGSWPEAETELHAAARQLAATRPAMQAEALLRLAELRRQQGRFREAGRLLEQVEGHPLVALARAALALDSGDAAAAAHLAERSVRQIPASNQTDRARARETLLRAELELGHGTPAVDLVDELRALAAEMRTPSFQASARTAEGLVALASGAPERARTAFEDAIDLYRQAHGLFEEARARVELARALVALGESASAAAELHQAQQTFRTLGAAWQVERVTSLLRKLTSVTASRRPETLTGGLSRREMEVLPLIAQGLSNKRIGGRLGVSEFTVKRHVGNILAKLDLPSRAAAAAFAARRDLL